MSTTNEIPFHVMKDLIESLKALEASDEARTYLMSGHTDPTAFEVYHLLQGVQYNFERPFFVFENPEKPEMSRELQAIVHTLTQIVGECLCHQNAPGNVVETPFYDALRERGYIAGVKRSQNDPLRPMHYINTEHGLFLVR